MKVGILGAGNIACKMTEAISDLDDSVEAYAIASRNLEKAEAFAVQWGFQKAYGSYKALIEDPMVYLATPHSHHFEPEKLHL